MWRCRWVSHRPPCPVLCPELRKGIQASAAGARSTAARPERSGDLSRSGCSTVTTLTEQRPGRGAVGAPVSVALASASETPLLQVSGCGMERGARALSSPIGVLGFLSFLPPPAVCRTHGRPALPPGLCWGPAFPPTDGEWLHLAPGPPPCAWTASWLPAPGSRRLPWWGGCRAPLLARDRPQPPGTERGRGARSQRGALGPAGTPPPALGPEPVRRLGQEKGLAPPWARGWGRFGGVRLWERTGRGLR